MPVCGSYSCIGIWQVNGIVYSFHKGRGQRWRWAVMSGCISHLSWGFILEVLQPAITILHEKTRRNDDPRWLYGVSGASAFTGSELCFCKGGCSKVSRVDGTQHWGWVAVVWPSFLRARKSLWRFNLLKDNGLTWYLWDVVSYLNPYPLAFLHLGTAVTSKILKS